MKTFKLANSDKIINYRVKYNSKRKSMSYKYITKNTALVLAPRSATEADIEKELGLSGDWLYNYITEQYRELGEVKADGVNQVYYQGELFKIETKESLVTGEAKIDFENKTINLDVYYKLHQMKGAEEFNERVKLRIKDLLAREAFNFINKLYNEVYDDTARKIGYTGAKPKLAVRKYVSRWGCYRSKDNLIIMNSYIMQASVEEIKTVLVHEICHTIQRDHGPGFHRLMAIARPEYRVLSIENSKRSADYVNWVAD